MFNQRSSQVIPIIREEGKKGEAQEKYKLSDEGFSQVAAKKTVQPKYFLFPTHQVNNSQSQATSTRMDDVTRLTELFLSVFHAYEAYIKKEKSLEEKREKDILLFSYYDLARIKLRNYVQNYTELCSLYERIVDLYIDPADRALQKLFKDMIFSDGEVKLTIPAGVFAKPTDDDICVISIEHPQSLEPGVKLS